MLPAGDLPQLALRIRQGRPPRLARAVPRHDEWLRRQDGEGRQGAGPRNARPEDAVRQGVLRHKAQLEGLAVQTHLHIVQRMISSLKSSKIKELDV